MADPGNFPSNDEKSLDNVNQISSTSTDSQSGSNGTQSFSFETQVNDISCFHE